MKKLLLLLLGALISFPAFATDFTYENEGQTLNYTILSEADKTCEVARNSSLTGDLSIPSIAVYEDVEYCVIAIGERAFYECRSLTSVEIPNSVAAIGEYAFYCCSGLTSIAIPNSVTSIGEAAFLFCRGLTSIEIPNSVNTIPDAAFYGCSGLTSVEIPNSVITIVSRAFSDCSGLTSVDIPNSVTSIGEYAFFCCSGLTSIAIPNSVTSIGESAFSGCENLREINCMAITPPSVTVSSFDELIYSEASLNVPEQSVRAYKLNDVWGEFSVAPLTVLIERITLAPDIWEGKEGETFSITAMVYPANATNRKLEWSSSNANVATVDAEGNVTALSPGSCEITAKATDGSSVTASCTVNVSLFTYEYKGQTLNYTVLSEADKTCEVAMNSSLTGDLSIPSTVAYDGEEYSVIAIGEKAFYQCSGLTSIAIPNSVASIGALAFYICSGLTSIEIPNSVTSIGRDAFLFCSGLTSIEIPNSVTSIPDDAFYGCSGLTSVAIPNSVITIGSGAFYNCYELTSVAIPNSVTSIGYFAFSGCYQLREINCMAITPPSVYDTSFDFDEFTYSEVSLNVPEQSVRAYRLNEFWGKFSVAPLTVIERITLDPDIWEGKEGGTFSITAMVYPADATNRKLEWSSSNANVAIVDADGKVTALSAGSCEITAKATDGSEVTASCTVNVSLNTGIEEVVAESGEPIAVYNLNGMLVMKTSDRARINELAPALYIIRQGNRVEKVVVK